MTPVRSGPFAVTGAYGYSGKYIARRLLARGGKVITLTNSPNRQNEFGAAIKAYPFSFDNPDALAESLQGVQVLFNTYWVRFNHSMFQHADAVQNTLALFRAAEQAGVRRVVHVSITNPSLDSRLEYFQGKAVLEKALIESGLSYAILRPTVLFGLEDILINNIAWMLRHLPFFGIFGDGQYRLQPIYVDDLAGLAVELGDRQENTILNAIGPETFTYRQLVQVIDRALGTRRSLVSVPPFAAYLAGRMLGILLRDVVVTRDEIEGLMANLLVVDTPPTGEMRFSRWVKENASELGRQYASELSRRRDRMSGYQ